MSKLVKSFEAAVYNKKVRDLVLMNESHPQFDDGWADQRFIPVEARDENQAKRMISLQFPEKKGFVLTNILEIPDFE
ncbi:hypothetical protein [Paremcibacter congregatus]|uniref:Uncharacterized protein n=1 Tax=Paremcibacter congregatus TaxID=2043170 RepID=A0A2G4YNV2_9PROT|nr:hypothetical protein [Paremcibacter congregatus]PHZ83983.1 hypothetical protein CRD36_14330 [Paremcibacter congregatus]QDE25923.1 hypothetical protein FIV45_00825 [Paremcibacter congregatus]